MGRSFVGQAGFQFASGRTFEAVLRAARAAPLPVENGEFCPHDFVELTELNSTIRLDLRYATADNFLGVQVYPEARAFLQQAVVQSLVAAHRRLLADGFGLVVLDAYRPWYVTKLFWELTPEEHRQFVANPTTGSGHNRGASVDVTLYDANSGCDVSMPSGYDEFSERARPDYEGGPAPPRRHRDVLRAAMEQEGFTVHTAEWWHFDHATVGQYALCNRSFAELAALSRESSS